MKATIGSIIAIFGLCASASAEVLFVDNFNGSISTQWTILRQDTNYYTVGVTSLDVRASSGDLISGRNDAKNTFLIPNPTSGDFVMTLKIDLFSPSGSSTPQIDLVAYDNDDNWVRGGYNSAGGSTMTQVVTEVGGGYAIYQQSASYGSNPFYMQLQKEGNVYTHRFSTDGVNYILYNAPVTYGDGTPAKLGFVVMDDPTESTHVFIDSFTVVPEPSSFALLLTGMACLMLVARRAALR